MIGLSAGRISPMAALEALGNTTITEASVFKATFGSDE
jgi:hypothetical protein